MTLIRLRSSIIFHGDKGPHNKEVMEKVHFTAKNLAHKCLLITITQTIVLSYSIQDLHLTNTQFMHRNNNIYLDNNK